MFRAFPRPIIRFSLQRRIGCTHYSLTNVVEAMRRVVSNLVSQLDTSIALLEVLCEVREAVELMEDGHHIPWSIIVAVECYCVGFWEIVVSSVGYYNVSSAG
jgi:hypothetical protein